MLSLSCFKATLRHILTFNFFVLVTLDFSKSPPLDDWTLTFSIDKFFRFNVTPVSPSLLLLSWSWPVPNGYNFPHVGTPRFCIMYTESAKISGRFMQRRSNTYILKNSAINFARTKSENYCLYCSKNPCIYYRRVKHPAKGANIMIYSFFNKHGHEHPMLSETLQCEISKKYYAKVFSLPGSMGIIAVSSFTCTVQLSEAVNTTLAERPHMYIFHCCMEKSEVEFSGLRIDLSLQNTSCKQVQLYSNFYSNSSLDEAETPTEFVLSDLLPGATYFYTLFALYNKIWLYQMASDRFGTIPSVPYVPRSVRVAGNGSNIRIRWNRPLSAGGENMSLSYIIQHSKANNGRWISEPPTTGTEWSIPDNIISDRSGGDLLFRVAAVNKIGQGNFSGPVRWLRETGSSTQQSIITGATAAITAVVLVSSGLVLIAVRYYRKKVKTARTLGPIILPRDLDCLPRVTLKDITINKELGEGSFGAVFEGLVCNLARRDHNVKNVIVVGKTLRAAFKTLRLNATETDRDDLIQEALTMRNLDHPNIIKLLGLCVDKAELWLILEMMDGGDLLSYLRSTRPTHNMPSHVTLLDLLRICKQIADGCKYLNEMGYVHRDLAARNCLVDNKDVSRCTVKISDFGLTRGVYEKCYYRLTEASLFPIRWAAPEVLRDHIFNPGCDIWSYGITLWEIMTLGDQPYNEKSDLEVIHFVRDGGSPDCPEWCPDPVYQLIKGCCNVDPSQRCSHAAIVDFLGAQIDDLEADDSDAPYIPALKDAEMFKQIKASREQQQQQKPVLYFDNPVAMLYADRWTASDSGFSDTLTNTTDSKDFDNACYVASKTKRGYMNPFDRLPDVANISSEQLQMSEDLSLDRSDTFVDLNDTHTTIGYHND